MRKEVIGNATLWLGDCREMLQCWPEVDHVITDPPYSENTHQMAKTNKGAGHGTKLVTFDSLSGEEFDKFMGLCLGVAYEWVIATCDYKHAARFYDHPRFVRLGAWVKPNPMPQISADRPGQGFETVLILHAGAVAKKWNRGGGAGVWTFPVNTASEVPTQKPLALLMALVEDFTEPGQSILDPCMGSGTTGVAALALGRTFVGMEQDEGRFSIACRRIEQAYKQRPLFDAEPPRKPEQLGIDA
jgi:site-specific DNA-methyltransferase (adenine-specific)